MICMPGLRLYAVEQLTDMNKEMSVEQKKNRNGKKERNKTR